MSRRQPDREPLDVALSRDADGDLDLGERLALEADPVARAALADFLPALRNVQRLLCDDVSPVPPGLSLRAMAILPPDKEGGPLHRLRFLAQRNFLPREVVGHAARSLRCAGRRRCRMEV